jgi:hypothetical protein
MSVFTRKTFIILAATLLSASMGCRSAESRRRETDRIIASIPVRRTHPEREVSEDAISLRPDGFKRKPEVTGFVPLLGFRSFVLSLPEAVWIDGRKEIFTIPEFGEGSLKWNRPTPEKNRLEYEGQTGYGRLNVELNATETMLTARLKVSNSSPEAWNNVTVLVRFDPSKIPDFVDQRLRRTFSRSSGKLIPLASLEHPKPMPKRLGFIHVEHRSAASWPLMNVWTELSSEWIDGTFVAIERAERDFVAGALAERLAFICCEREIPSIVIGNALGDIPPAGETETTFRFYFYPAGIEAFAEFAEAESGAVVR